MLERDAGAGPVELRAAIARMSWRRRGTDWSLRRGGWGVPSEGRRELESGRLGLFSRSPRGSSADCLFELIDDFEKFTVFGTFLREVGFIA